MPIPQLPLGVEQSVLPILAANIYWRDLPILIVLVSLVYGATRFDDWEHILRESFRWMIRLSGFLVAVMAVLYVLARFFV